jgi:ankyrin repeat protein
MALASLPPELILHLSNFLCDSSLNGLIQTQKLFAHLLTPILYQQFFPSSKTKHLRPKAVDPNAPPISWYHCLRHWRSDILLSYIRSRPGHVLKNNIRGTNQTLLHVAAHSGNVLLADILVHEKGMDINSESQDGETPLFEAINSNTGAMFKWLIDNGADSTRVNSEGRTVLEETAFRCLPGMIHVVLNTLKYQDPGNLTADNLDKALHCSLWSCREPIVRALLEYGADPSAVDHGTTALDCALICGREDIVNTLLDFGANPIPFNTLRRSVLWRAVDAEFGWETIRRIVEATLRAGGDIKEADVLKKFAAQACLPAVKELLRYGADVLSPDTDGVTALHMALFRYSEDPSPEDAKDYEQVCQTLIKAINVAVCNGGEFDHSVPRKGPFRGGTSLHLAAKCGSETVMRMLLDSGVDRTTLDFDGKSALDIAILAGQQGVARLLEFASSDL